MLVSTLDVVEPLDFKQENSTTRITSLKVLKDRIQRSKMRNQEEGIFNSWAVRRVQSKEMRIPYIKKILKKLEREREEERERES